VKFIGLKKGVIGVFAVVNILYDIPEFGILNAQKNMSLQYGIMRQFCRQELKFFLHRSICYSN